MARGSSWGRELSSAEPRAGEHCPWGAAGSAERGSRREALSNAGPLGAYTGGRGDPLPGSLSRAPSSLKDVAEEGGVIPWPVA